MRFLRWVLGIVVVLAAAVFGGGYLLPSDVTLERRIDIAAPPEKIFAIVGDLNRFNEWSPWAAMDPKATYKVEGAPGVGQSMSWTSDVMGAGSQRVAEIVPNRSVTTALDFGQAGDPSATLAIEPAATGSTVVWTFRSGLPGPIDRWFGLMLPSMIGEDYETGLAALKALAEKP